MNKPSVNGITRSDRSGNPGTWLDPRALDGQARLAWPAILAQEEEAVRTCPNQSCDMAVRGDFAVGDLLNSRVDGVEESLGLIGARHTAGIGPFGKFE